MIHCVSYVYLITSEKQNARQYFDLKQKPNLAENIQSVFVSDELIEQLYNNSLSDVKNNLILKQQKK